MVTSPFLTVPMHPSDCSSMMFILRDVISQYSSTDTPLQGAHAPLLLVGHHDDDGAAGDDHDHPAPTPTAADVSAIGAYVEGRR